MRAEEANVEAIEGVISRLYAAVESEPGTLIYEFARAGDTLHLYERYDDLAALMAHVGNTQDLTAELFAIAPITAVVTLSTLPDELMPVFESYNAVIAQPVRPVAN